MLDLREIGLFAGLSPEELDVVRGATQTRTLASGETICRQGDCGESLYVVAGGGVRVFLTGENGRRRGELYFGPGGVFGEMSLISEMPVAATVVTARPTILYTLDKDAFHQLLRSQPNLYASLTKLLVARVRHRSALDQNTLLPSCALLVLPELSPQFLQIAALLFRGVEHYAPGSVFPSPLNPLSRTAGEGEQDIVIRLDDSPSPATREKGTGDEGLEQRLSRWRETAAADQFLVLAVSREEALQLRAKLRDRDAVLFLQSNKSDNSQSPAGEHFGLADCAFVRCNAQSESQQHSPGIWQYSLAMPSECEEEKWNFPHTHVLDRIVRWITRREIGVALGSGSARGFAHLAILKALEDAKIPLDCAFGTSIGGIVAAIYGFAGDATRATELVREHVASDKKVRDFSWLRLPRASVMAGRKVRRQASALFGDATLADFHIPTATVAVDLVQGARVVLDRGSAVEAVLATSAIPGIYPPVLRGDEVLVDGGIVSQVPADLFSRRRCGLRLAVNVAPSPEATRPTPAEIAEFKKRLGQHFGLFSILERSWDLLAWWHGASDAGAADIFLEPTTDRRAGASFDSLDQMMEFGQRAVDARLDDIKTAAQNALRPGTP